MELSATVILALFLAAVLLYRHFSKTFSYFKERGIPYVSPWKTNTLLLQTVFSKVHGGEIINLVYEELKDEPIGGYFRFTMPVFLVKDPEILKIILMKNFHNFNKNEPSLHPDNDPIASRSPFFLTGEKWKRMRSQLSPAFTSGKIRLMFPLILEVCDKLKSYLLRMKPSDDIEVKDLATRYTINSVIWCSLGVNANALEDPESRFRKIGKEMFSSGFWFNLKFMTMFVFPTLAKILGFKVSSTKTVNFFRSVTKDILAQRQTSKVNRNDFLRLLLQLREKGRITEEENVDKPADVISTEYSEDDLIAHVMTFFFEGFETSSVSFSFALFEIAQNPDVQEKLRDEIESTLRENNGKIDYDTLTNMKYLDMVFSESMRKQPVGNALSKVCVKTCEIETSNCKLRIEEGTPITIPSFSIQRDAKYYPDPNKFNPERFNEENIKKLNRFTYLSFGEGPRICIGMRFAIAQVKAAILTIVKDFEISVSSKTLLPIEYDPAYFLYNVKGGLWLNFKKRF